MNAAEVLQMARAAAVRVSIDGDDLVLAASAPPASFVLELLSSHKAGILALLRSTDDELSAEDWQVFFDERAGIAEFDGGLSRGYAEVGAFECCVADWLRRNPARSLSERCATCGSVHEHKSLLLYGVETTGNPWLHSRCWPAWDAGRKAEAVAALEAIGIAVPANLPDYFGKTGARDGRLWLRTAERLGARYGGRLPLDRRKPASQGGLSSAGLAG
jgi:hypothetical protein